MRIIEYTDITRLARPCSCDPDIAEAFITEAQECDIRPNIGDDVYADVLKSLEAADDKYKTLLDGGEFLDACGRKRLFVGLRKTLAYYAYARIVKSGSNLQTRYGFVNKNDEYSMNVEFKQRHQAYTDAFAVANQLMTECLSYMRTDKDLFPNCAGPLRNSQTKYSIIGRR